MEKQLNECPGSPLVEWNCYPGGSGEGGEESGGGVRSCCCSVVSVPSPYEFLIHSATSPERAAASPEKRMKRNIVTQRDCLRGRMRVVEKEHCIVYLKQAIN